jgi:hypothetical protein
MIPRATYANAASRLMLFTPLVFPSFAAVGMVVAAFIGLPIAIAIRDLAGGDLGMALAIAAILPFGVLPILLPVAAMLFIDRRIGIRCPNCNVSLTMRCLHEQVLITRRCSHCKATVLLDDEYQSNQRKSRPWLIAVLLVIGVLGIVVAIALPIVAPRPVSANPQAGFAEWGVFVGLLLGIALIQAAINRVLKRRWQREAGFQNEASASNEKGN